MTVRGLLSILCPLRGRGQIAEVFLAEMNQRERSRAFTKEVKTLAQEHVSKEPLTVLVMGPNTDDKRLGAKLRRKIIDLCNDNELAVKAEHSEIRAEVRKELKRGYTLTHLEILMARKSDLIVIIPDSAGSIAELGYFALLEDICHKLIILFGRKYLTARTSYIAQGPGKAAKHFGATVRFVNYRRSSEAWEIISSRIEIGKAQKVLGPLERQGK